MVDKRADTIFLCGFMGAGKSTIGQKLADALELPFQDLDTLIEDKTGMSIRDLFEEKGEPYFRKAERAILTGISRSFKGVLALGGGALYDEQLVKQIKLYGLLIFIDTPFSVILERISNSKQRPLLLDDRGKLKKKETLERELTSLYEQRLPLYRQADITLQTGRFDSVEPAVKELIKKITHHGTKN